MNRTTKSPSPRSTRPRAHTQSRPNPRSNPKPKSRPTSPRSARQKSIPQSSAARQRAARRATKPARTIFNQIVLIFAIGCIFGTYYEELLTIVKNFLANGTFEWFSRRGLVYGPFSPVYGIGAVGIYLIFYRTHSSWPACLVGGALLGGAFEFFISLLQEWIFGTRSWNYEGRILDIGGRTTVPYMVFWGLLVALAVQWLYPLLDHAYERLAGKTFNHFCLVLAGFLIFDISMSIAASLRQSERRAGDPADNAIEIFFDRRFPDERMRQIYSNTQEAK